MARIVVAVSSLSGHVQPMLLIGAHLRNQGHDVVVLTGDEYRAEVLRAGLPMELVRYAGTGHEFAPSALGHLLPRLISRYLNGRAEVRSTFVTPLSVQYQAIRELLAREPADAVLADLAFTGVLPLLLSDGPRPVVMVCGVAPLTLSSRDAPPFGMAWHPRPGVDYTGLNRAHRLLMGGIHRKLDRALNLAGVRAAPVALVDWPTLADRMAQLTVEAFEYPRADLPATVEFVGPVLPESAEGFHTPAWWDAMVAAPTVVHVTQGTFDNDNLGQLVEPTLQALRHHDVAVVVTTGRRADRPFRSSVPANAYVAEWIPYAHLLPHVDVMITNGGYGGVQQALRYGVPLIVAGESSDKAEVGARVAYAGAGVNLRTATPRPIAAAVRRIMSMPTYRQAARRLGRQMVATDARQRITALLAAEIKRSTACPSTPEEC